MNDPIPPAWEDLASSRERLARIETKVDIILSTQTIHGEKMVTLELRQTALEQGLLANRGDIGALKEKFSEWERERKQFSYSLPQFMEWMNKVDGVVKKVGDGILISTTTGRVRAQDWAIISGTIGFAFTAGIALMRFIL